MDINLYKERLQAQERDLAARWTGAVASARASRDEPAGDAGDESVSDDLKESSVREASADSTLLAQVREALARIDNGTYGECLVDGGPIEESRLDAVPWAAYCLRHQTEMEGDSVRPPTM
jgi:DnaK suppressor protein